MKCSFNDDLYWMGPNWNDDDPLEGKFDSCPDGLLPDGPICPRCGKNRAPSGIGGGTWVHWDGIVRTTIVPAKIS